MSIKIAIDMAGGDYGLDTTIPACIRALASFDDITLILVGRNDAILSALKRYDKIKHYQHRYQIHHANEVISMAEDLRSALKNKRDSSMRIAIKLVKDKIAEAAVSAGNSGALMAISKLILKTIPGIDRPALFTSLPTTTGQNTYMLDLGANIDSNAINLLSFAVMGTVLVKYVQNIENPRIALLNIGSEDIKGRPIIKEASELLKKSGLNYVGFIEGDTLYTKPVDVVVCDGFEGNLVLKASEGVASMIKHYLKRSFVQSTWTKVSALLAKSALNHFQATLDPRKYNGASLLGLRGTVIKSHGSADAKAFFYAIKEARLEATKQITNKIQQEIQEKLALLERKQ